MLGSISIDDINEALPRALPLLAQYGQLHTADSLANPRETIEWPGLFITEYRRPTRNVLFDPVRDANPFFHFLEAMWIITGRNDVAFLKHVLPNMATYSDDGKVFHGAYGYRLRTHFGIDQINRALSILAKSPKSRQVAISIWDPEHDLGRATKDMPCNDFLMLKVREGKLNLTVCNRSNDAIWGCYGANVVQFSMLQMYMAARLGLEVGTYCQMSDSFHVYTDTPYWKWFVEQYETGGTMQIMHATEQARTTWSRLDDTNLFEEGLKYLDWDLSVFFQDAQKLIENGGGSMKPFARSVAVQTAVNMWNILHWHRIKQPVLAFDEARKIGPDGWRTAAYEWLQRREAKKGKVQA